MKHYLTIDVGGTAIKYAVMDEVADIISRGEVETPKDTLENFVETIGQIYDEVSGDVEGIAMSLPGIIDPVNGHNYTGGALLYINDLDTVKVLQERCHCPITIGNDAKCAANAEIGFGSLQDVDDAICVILGTGVGGCLIKDHKVHTGKHFSAGEFSFAQTNIKDEFKFSNAWGTISGWKQLVRYYNAYNQTDIELNGKQFFELVNNNDENAMKALDQFTYELAVMLYNVHVIFDAQKIAIGGGISAQTILIDYIKKNMDKVFDAVPYDFPKTEIVTCQFRNDANLIGALYQFRETYK